MASLEGTVFAYTFLPHNNTIIKDFSIKDHIGRILNLKINKNSFYTNGVDENIRTYNY